MFSLGTDSEFFVLCPERLTLTNPYHAGGLKEVLGADSTSLIAEIRTKPSATVVEQLLNIGYAISLATYPLPHIAIPSIGSFSAGGHIHTEFQSKNNLITNVFHYLADAMAPILHWWEERNLGFTIANRLLLGYGATTDWRSAVETWTPRQKYPKTRKTKCECNLCELSTRVSTTTATTAIEIRCWPTGLVHPAHVAYAMECTREIARAAAYDEEPNLHQFLPILKFAEKTNPMKDFRRNWKIRPTKQGLSNKQDSTYDFLAMNDGLNQPIRIHQTNPGEPAYLPPPQEEARTIIYHPSTLFPRKEIETLIRGESHVSNSNPLQPQARNRRPNNAYHPGK